jgi:hypothetical protein
MFLTIDDDSDADCTGNNCLETAVVVEKVRPVKERMSSRRATLKGECQSVG